MLSAQQFGRVDARHPASPADGFADCPDRQLFDEAWSQRLHFENVAFVGLDPADCRDRWRQVIEHDSRGAHAEILPHLRRDANSLASALIRIFGLKLHVHRRLARRVVALHRHHWVVPIFDHLARAILGDAVDDAAVSGFRRRSVSCRPYPIAGTRRGDCQREPASDDFLVGGGHLATSSVR